MYKLKIVVCDDVYVEQNKTKKLLNEYQQLHKDLKLEVIAFKNPKLAKNYLFQYLDTDIAILDICMPELNGMELAQAIRKEGCKCMLIFLSVSQDYALDAFAVNAMQYLLKPIDKTRFFQTLDQVVELKTKGDNNELILKSNQKYYKIDRNHIVNVESDKNYQYCYMHDGLVLKVRMTLQQLYNLLEDEVQFAKCGASFIINWRYVVTISKSHVELMNGKTIPIPRRTYLLLKEQYFAYYCGEENATDEI